MEVRAHHAIPVAQVVVLETVEHAHPTVVRIVRKVALVAVTINVILHVKTNAVRDVHLHVRIPVEEIALRNVLEVVLNLVKAIARVIVVLDATQIVANHVPRHVPEVARKTVLATAQQNALMDAVIIANLDARQIVRVTVKDAPRRAPVSALRAEEIANQHAQDVLAIAGVPAKVVAEQDVHPDAVISASTDANQIVQAVLQSVVDVEKDAILDVMQTAQANATMDANPHVLTDVHTNAFQIVKDIVLRPAMMDVIPPVMTVVIRGARAPAKQVATIRVRHPA